MAARQHFAYHEEPDESGSDVIDHEESDESGSDVIDHEESDESGSDVIDHEESDESGSDVIDHEESDESDTDVDDHEEYDEYYSDVDYFYEDRDDYDTCQTKFEKFKSLRERVDLKIREDRNRFSRLLNVLVDDWEDQLPDLREFFRREEIDLLLSEDIQLYAGTSELRPLVEFVIRTGYKDEPELDEDGNPVLRRTTPVHWAGRNTEKGWFDPNMSILFEIYDRFDVNYTDEDGLTHFHVACMSGSEDIVEKFLELGQDLDCLTQELPLALKYEHKEVFELLLRYGADPTSINADGSTILHIILKRDDHGGYDDEWMEILFEVTDEKQQLMLVNARDKLGQTPLHLAVANLLPDAVEILLDHGADMSNFVFPDYNDYEDSVDSLLNELDGVLKISACTLVIIECLEKKGYEMSRSDVVSIMKLFVDDYWFIIYDTNIEFCLRNKEVANNYKELIIKPGLSYYDSIWLSTEETRKRITCKDFLRFVTSYEWMMSEFYYRDDGMNQLNAKMWRGFCCRWGLEFFYEFINHRLPILCCKIIVDKLKNTDLMNLCLAAEINSKKQS